MMVIYKGERRRKNVRKRISLGFFWNSMFEIKLN